MVQQYLSSKEVEFEQVDAFANPKRSSQYEIGSLPTLILTEDNGDEVKRVIGFKPPEIDELIQLKESSK